MLTIDREISKSSPPPLLIHSREPGSAQGSIRLRRVTLNNADSAPARAYGDASRRLNGEELDMVVAGRAQGLMDRLLGTEGA